MVTIIAEAGVNHNGSYDSAISLIDIAVNAGADAVKFQKRTIDLVYTQDFLDASRESPWGTTQREQKEGLEFGLNDYTEIDKYCKEKGIEWFASAWDLESQKFLQQFDLQHNKIASAMLVYEDLLKMVASEGRHTFISTGLSTLEDIDRAVNIFKDVLEDAKVYGYFTLDFVLMIEKLFKNIMPEINLYEKGAVTELNQDHNQDQNLSVLDLAKNHHLGVLINRPLNAIVDQQIRRLAEYEKEDEQKDDDKSANIEYWSDVHDSARGCQP